MSCVAWLVELFSSTGPMQRPGIQTGRFHRDLTQSV